MSGLAKELSDHEVGTRLRMARETAEITQARAATIAGVSRTTIVAIEQGHRKARINEVQKLAAAYGTSANDLLRREAVHLDMVPRFRKLEEASDEATVEAVGVLNDLVRAEVELEDVLGVERKRNYPPESPLLPGNVEAQAESDAQDLRNWLGLGSGPVLDALAVLDLHLGVRVYLRPLDATVSGLFAYDERIGAVVLLNANHPYERRQQSACHELGHFVSTRDRPEILREGQVSRSRGERYANSFSRCFLTPRRAVAQRFAQTTAGHTHLTRRHVILLAHTFGVSRQAMVLRLEELGLAKRGSWDWFEANGRITDKQAFEVLGTTPRETVAATSLVPPRITLLAREAARRGLYSEGQLSRLLKLDRVAVRELLGDLESDVDDLLELPS